MVLGDGVQAGVTWRGRWAHVAWLVPALSPRSALHTPTSAPKSMFPESRSQGHVSPWSPNVRPVLDRGVWEADWSLIGKGVC